MRKFRIARHLYIVGVGQQNINLFGIGAKKRLQKQRIALAETAFDLSALQVEQEVKKAWSEAYQQRQKFELYVNWIPSILNLKKPLN
ncbi:hypothetical protein Q2T40_02025 [Winogradskyella maritima]|nr:hypothetical protein [Winogradskyella maritima]